MREFKGKQLPYDLVSAVYKNKYKDNLSQSLHEIAEDLYSVGAMDSKTFEDIKNDCLEN